MEESKLFAFLLPIDYGLLWGIFLSFWAMFHELWADVMGDALTSVVIDSRAAVSSGVCRFNVRLCQKHWKASP